MRCLQCSVHKHIRALESLLYVREITVITRDRARFNLGYIWPIPVTKGPHRPYLYMITSSHAKLEAQRHSFWDLLNRADYRCGLYPCTGPKPLGVGTGCPLEVPRPPLGVGSFRRSARTPKPKRRTLALSVTREGGLSSTDERESREGSCHRSHTGSSEVVQMVTASRPHV